MNINDPRYTKLRDAVLNEIASEHESAQLENMILASTDLRRDFTEHLHLRSNLAWQLSNGPLPDQQFATQPSPTALSAQTTSHRWLPSMAIAATVLAAILGYWTFAGRNGAKTFAVLASAADCAWGECTLPTSIGIHLGSGRLRLNSGIATLQFPNVVVTLEGFVDLEIIDERSCRVLAGKLFTEVSPGGEGFTVLTPTAHFVDRGTRFGIEVEESGVTNMSVVQGKVSVRHLSSNTTQDVLEQESVIVTRSGLDRQQGEELSGRLSPKDDAAGNLEPLLLTTAAGRGDDAYVVSDRDKDRHKSSTILLVKRPARSNPKQWYAAWRRKAFLRFDLTPAEDAEIGAASFQIQGLDTGIGYRALMPDAQFAIYGLIDESQDNWKRSELDWQDSPASHGELLEPDPEAAVLLGRFVVKQSRPDDAFQISNENLLEFIRSDTNGLVTLIIVCETMGGEGETYVHGFASWRHPTLSPPSLRLMLH